MSPTPSKTKKTSSDQVGRMLSSLSKDSIYIDLSKKLLDEIPLELYDFTWVENLYLSENNIQELPEDFFEHFPHLKWLDLRDNQLTFLPASIGDQRNLKNLLLEQNNIEHLPRELARTSLTGLSLSGNPLITPPEDIVQKGVRAVLAYLALEEQNDVNENNFTTEENLDYTPKMYSSFLYRKTSIEPEIEDRMTQNPIYSVQNLEDLGPHPIPASLHDPRSSYILREKLQSQNRKSNSNTVSKERIKDWKKNERRKNKAVLDEWREEARKLQQSLLPRSKTDIIPPYGIDVEEPLARPITTNETPVHTEVHEETVNTVLPDRSDGNNFEKPEKKVETKMTVKQLMSLDHFSIKESPKKKVEHGHKGKVEHSHKKSGDIAVKYCQALQQKSKNLREKLDNKVQSRMRLYSSQLQSRRQKAKNGNESQSRELQRHLLDRKMDRDPQLEYRFKAFTGDSSSNYSSSNKTSSL